MPTVFLHGDLLREPPLAAWLEHTPSRPAWTRGGLWRAGRPQRVLVPGAGEDKVGGILVDLDDDRVHVLDLLFGGPGVRRQAIRAAVGLRPVPCEAWVLPDARTAHAQGYRPIRRTT